MKQLIGICTRFVGWLLGLTALFYLIVLPTQSSLAIPAQVGLLAPTNLAQITQPDPLSMCELLLKRSYLKAIEDAQYIQELEVYKDLWTIDSQNTSLTWRDDQENKQVLAVTWTSWNGYDDKVGLPVELSREVWVTAVPELREFGRTLNLDPESLTLRLEQYLGLPPHNGKTRFVEMWVNPSDLFRPCPDTEISDNTCGLDFPQNVELTHKDWFDKLKLVSYGSTGYPWTRLGYTYDWGSLDTERGASEFVIKKGAKVIVKSVKPTVEYFQ